MGNLAVTIPPSLENLVRDFSNQSKISVDSLVGAALSTYLESLTPRIYQVSTSTALVEGIYTGSHCSSTLLQHGDFGLGAFEGLDGEMIILDGEIYQAAGTVRHRADEFLIPFAAVTQFRKMEIFEIGAVACLKDIELACDQHRVSQNLFYAVRLDGVFDTMHTRAVHAVPQNTRLLDAAKAELEFHFDTVAGTLVCLWSPRYSSAFSVPGYHFHFLSDDRTKGGHVLNCTARKLQASIQTIFEYDIRLPETGSFLTTDLSKDPTSDLGKTE
ncbi:MAG TPA: acetolactate decarboxylase [Terriglobales bacterium]|jgi:acetolactate decarboxylase|nr:acetolactate decarboxylase [Terriglobales bacterium]